MNTSQTKTRIAGRFRGFLPVVVDLETGGFNSRTDALLEIAAVLLRMDEEGKLSPDITHTYHVQPFEDANIEAKSLEITGIDPHHPLRPAIPEREALRRLFREVRAMLNSTGCSRAVLVGHNAFFDLTFLNAAIARTGIKRNPFHSFTSFDTATLAGAALGQTVLSRAIDALGLQWESDEAHSAAYDATMTAELFCTIVNRLQPTYEASLADQRPADL